MNEFDDIGRELHAMRAEPRPEFARELDRRAAEWLRKKRGRSLFLHPRPAMAAAAAAAAAVVLALVVSGGDEGGAELQVAVISDQGAAEALGSPLQRDSAAPAEGAFSMVESTSVKEAQPVVLRYFFSASVEGTIALAGREATVTVGPGSGRVEISTEGLPVGTHRLEVAFPPMPLQRERIEITGG